MFWHVVIAVCILAALYSLRQETMSKRKSKDEEPSMEFAVSTGREFPNPFAEYSGGKLPVVGAAGKVYDEFSSRLRPEIARFVQKLEREYNESTIDYRDSSVYTGTAGVGLLYFHLSEKLRDADSSHNLRVAGTFADSAVKNLRRRAVSFLGGDAGPLAFGAVVYQRLGRAPESRDCIDRLLAMNQQVLIIPACRMSCSLVVAATCLHCSLFDITSAWRRCPKLSYVRSAIGLLSQDVRCLMLRGQVLL